jgi:hypothetical protein
MKKHIQLLGILHIVYNSISLLVGIGLFIFFSSIGAITGNEIAIGVMGLLGFLLGGLLTFFAIPGIIAGIGLLFARPWARILAMIVACIDAFSIPIGTALTVYTFWVLLNDEAIKEFSQSS